MAGALDGSSVRVCLAGWVLRVINVIRLSTRVSFVKRHCALLAVSVEVVTFLTLAIVIPVGLVQLAAFVRLALLESIAINTLVLVGEAVDMACAIVPIIAHATLNSHTTSSEGATSHHVLMRATTEASVPHWGIWGRVLVLAIGREYPVPSLCVRPIATCMVHATKGYATVMLDGKGKIVTFLSARLDAIKASALPLIAVHATRDGSDLVALAFSSLDTAGCVPMLSSAVAPKVVAVVVVP